jgi:hypothetical protein
MFPKIHPKAIIALFIGIFLFAFVMQNNCYMLPKLLISEGFSEGAIEDIELLELLSCIIVGFILIQLVNIVGNRNIMIFGLVCYIGAMVCLITIKEHDLLKVYFMIMAGGSFCYISLILIKIVEYAEQNKNYSLAIFFLSWSMGYLCAENVTDFFDPSSAAELFINTFLCCLVTITVFFDEELICNYASHNVKFSILAEHIELQVITGFIVSYITMSLFYYYDAFAVISGMAIAGMGLAKYYMLTGVLIFIMPATWLLSNMNKYLFNLLLVLGFLFSFILLPIYGINELSNIFLLMAMGVCLCSIFVCNISILSDKFEGNEFRASILIYFSMTAIGAYCGAFAAEAGGDITNKQFIGSICLITVFFLAYYLWRFIKLRLY